MEKYKLYDNKPAKCYEYRIEDYRPKIDYALADNVISLTHTRIPEELRGKGIGTMLVKDVLDDISSRNLKLVPLCGFVATYIKRHPEYNRLLKEGIYIG